MTSIKLNSLVLMFIVIFFSGFTFGTPKIDTTTDETMKTSIQKVKDSLKANQQKEFEEAIKLIMFSQIDMRAIFANAMAGKQMDQEKLQNDMKKSLHGKTGLEVIALAKEKKKQRQAENNKREKERISWQKEQDLKDLKKLREKKSQYDKAKVGLSQFKVVNSRFYKQRQNEYSSRLSPIIELEVRNESKYPISRIFCKGTIRSEGRSVPWLVEDFNYQISGGLEPNETRDWSLAPNMFSEWGRVDAPADAIFEVEITGVDGSDGKELYSLRGFSERDKEKLEKLEKKYK